MRRWAAKKDEVEAEALHRGRMMEFGRACSIIVDLKERDAQQRSQCLVAVEEMALMEREMEDSARRVSVVDRESRLRVEEIDAAWQAREQIWRKKEVAWCAERAARRKEEEARDAERTARTKGEEGRRSADCHVLDRVWLRKEKEWHEEAGRKDAEHTRDRALAEAHFRQKEEQWIAERSSALEAVARSASEKLEAAMAAAAADKAAALAAALADKTSAALKAADKLATALAEASAERARRERQWQVERAEMEAAGRWEGQLRLRGQSETQCRWRYLLCCIATHRMLQCELSGGFSSWVAFSEDHRMAERRLRQAAHTLRSSNLSLAFCSWRAGAQTALRSLRSRTILFAEREAHKQRVGELTRKLATSEEEVRRLRRGLPFSDSDARAAAPTAQPHRGAAGHQGGVSAGGSQPAGAKGAGRAWGRVLSNLPRTAAKMRR